MSSIHEFSDALRKEIADKTSSLYRELVKSDATKHDRYAGRILAFEEANTIIKELTKRWSSDREEI